MQELIVTTGKTVGLVAINDMIEEGIDISSEVFVELNNLL